MLPFRSAMTTRNRALLTATTVVLIAATVLAQGRRFGGGGFGGFGGLGGLERRRGGSFSQLPNIRYDGQFTFVRLKYTTAPGGYWYRGWPSWAHGYPIAERNLMKIINELSYVGAHADAINVLALDDPELFKYPVAYIIEGGWWTMTDREGAGLRAYLQKGGFVIFDDFREYFDGTGWETFEAQMHRVIPEARFLDLDSSHPIFHSFFDVTALDRVPQYYDIRPPVFRGLFEDNDSSKRMMAMVNFNTDISNFWEFSDKGLKPVDDSNEAYKLGVNYVVYGLTH